MSESIPPRIGETVAGVVSDIEQQKLRVLIEKLRREFGEVIDKFSYRQEINGLNTAISKNYVTCNINGAVLYARLFKTFETSPQMGICYLGSNDTKVTGDIFASGMRITEQGLVWLGSDISSIIVDLTLKECKHFGDVVTGIWESSVGRARSHELEQENIKRERRNARNNYLKERWYVYVGAFAYMTSVAVIIGGTYNNMNDVPVFTDPAGRIDLGSTASPLYSPELAGDLTVGDRIGDLASLGLPPGELRDFTLKRRSVPRQFCEQFEIPEEDRRIGHHLNAWTDAVRPSDGKPLPESVQITYKYDSVEACWKGGSRPTEGDVRIVVVSQKN